MAYWLQSLIACTLSIGIGKKELLEDYYLDEIGEIIHEYNKLHNPDTESEAVTYVTGDAFFGF